MNRPECDLIIGIRSHSSRFNQGRNSAAYLGRNCAAYLGHGRNSATCLGHGRNCATYLSHGRNGIEEIAPSECEAQDAWNWTISGSECTDSWVLGQAWIRIRESAHSMPLIPAIRSHSGRFNQGRGRNSAAYLGRGRDSAAKSGPGLACLRGLLACLAWKGLPPCDPTKQTRKPSKPSKPPRPMSQQHVPLPVRWLGIRWVPYSGCLVCMATMLATAYV